MAIESLKRRLRRHAPGRLLYDLRGLGRSLQPVGPLPDFVIIGAQKGGTTALFQMLAQHPDVSPSVVKEVHFFDLNYDRGEAWYRRHFRENTALRTGEASPYYLFHPEAPGRLQAMLPSAQLIVILRDPVERALSHYFHSVRRGYEILPLLEALEAEESRLAGEAAKLTPPGGRSYNHQHFSYVARSRYPEQIERWRALFPDRQILLMSNRDLRHNADPTFGRVCDFLGIPPVPAPALAREIGGEKPDVPPAARRFLEDRLGDVAARVREAYGLEL